MSEESGIEKGIVKESAPPGKEQEAKALEDFKKAALDCWENRVVPTIGEKIKFLRVVWSLLRKIGTEEVAEPSAVKLITGEKKFKQDVKTRVIGNPPNQVLEIDGVRISSVQTGEKLEVVPYFGEGGFVFSFVGGTINKPIKIVIGATERAITWKEVITSFRKGPDGTEVKTTRESRLTRNLRKE